MDMKAIVSKGDIVLDKPVHRRESGMPIGSGVMGTLVWTTPHSIGMQINRTDVYASDGSSMSFPERHSDYGYGCGYVEIDLYEFGRPVFAESQTKQHLDIYDGALTLAGEGVSCTILAWHSRDVIAIRIEDSREKPPPS